LPTARTVPPALARWHGFAVRNRYLDLLRAVAIVRVIVYHLFGWPWLSIVLPAMGIMFALAGSLTAASLDRRAAGQVVVSRLRRLLPPLWLLGVIAVPVMLVLGWQHETDGEHPFSPSRLLFWLLPVADPPGSDKGIDVWEPLWYIRAYVWFALLSPVLYVIYKRLGWFAVVLPLVLIALLDVTDFSLPDTADAALWDFVTYGACWIAGFAHHDGRLARLRPWLLVPLTVAVAAVALWWQAGNQGEDPWDLNDVSESQALWSLAFVLLALRWQPAMGWLARVRPLDRAVSVLNARAVTVYLWHNIAIAAVWPVLTVLALDDFGGRLEAVTEFSMALVLTLFAVVAFGWAEDLAARRRPALWPADATKPRATTDEPAPTPLLADAGPAARRDGVAAAMHRMPANWPPAPRTAHDNAAEHYAAADRVAEGRIAEGRIAADRVADHHAAEGRYPAPTVSELAVQGRHAAEEAMADPGMQAMADPSMPVAGRPPEPPTAGWFGQRAPGDE
jgi:peptidoglycan/LPS O-acetylase OafA/YrhL